MGDPRDLAPRSSARRKATIIILALFVLLIVLLNTSRADVLYSADAGITSYRIFGYIVIMCPADIHCLAISRGGNTSYEFANFAIIAPESEDVLIIPVLSSGRSLATIEVEGLHYAIVLIDPGARYVSVKSNVEGFFTLGLSSDTAPFGPTRYGDEFVVRIADPYDVATWESEGAFMSSVRIPPPLYAKLGRKYIVLSSVFEDEAVLRIDMQK